jgi:hypothetical protein
MTLLVIHLFAVRKVEAMNVTRLRCASPGNVNNFVAFSSEAARSSKMARALFCGLALPAGRCAPRGAHLGLGLVENPDQPVKGQVEHSSERFPFVFGHATLRSLETRDEAVS